MAFDLINRFIKTKFNKNIKNDFKLLIKFILYLVNNLKLLKEFI
jgi:hypothetical protein